MFKVIWGLFGVLFSKWPVTKKIARGTAKSSEIWDSWILVTHIWGTFVLVWFKVIWVIWCIFLKMACNSITAGVRAKLMKFGSHGY